MAKVVVLVDPWTDPRATHIMRKRMAARVRCSAAHEHARDREGARERDRWGLDRVLLCHCSVYSLPSLPGRPTPRIRGSLPGRQST